MMAKGEMMALWFLVLTLHAVSVVPQVLLLAQGRSGSTWVASWLESHPDALFFLEPCSNAYQTLTATESPRKDVIGEDCAVLHRQLFQCDFTNVQLDAGSRGAPTEGSQHWGNTSAVDNCQKRIKVIKVFQ
jgi:hypothetical protein